MGIEGAGWATVIGSWASALLAFALLLRPRFQKEFATGSTWRPEGELFRRLMTYGGPAGLQVFLDVLVFHLFTQFIGRLGEAELGATTLTVRLNMIAFVPMMGLAQAVCILVGQRLGGNRPDLAEKSVYTGLGWICGYMCVIATMYLSIPKLLVSVFESEENQAQFAEVAEIVPTLLVCVAIYSLADALNFAFSFALRGAGHALCLPAHLLPGMAHHGHSDRDCRLARGARPMALGVRDRLYNRHGDLLLPALP